LYLTIFLSVGVYPCGPKNYHANLLKISFISETHQCLREEEFFTGLIAEIAGMTLGEQAYREIAATFVNANHSACRTTEPSACHVGPNFRWPLRLGFFASPQRAG
jgi:hypothetical protein